jgi:hypothetical protein
MPGQLIVLMGVVAVGEADATDPSFLPLIRTTPAAMLHTQIGTTATMLNPPPGARKPDLGKTVTSFARFSAAPSTPTHPTHAGSARVVREENEAASALFLSESAVEKHVHSIFAKLGLSEEPQLHRRVAAVLTYLRDPHVAAAEG